jgi:hypothetical protein
MSACARDSGDKITASAHDMGSGYLAVDAMVIGCLGVERRMERFFILSHFLLGSVHGVLYSVIWRGWDP